jgi:hypothetical protein
MKLKIIILSLVLSFAFIQAQNPTLENFSTSKFGFGLHSDLASIPLNDQNFQSSVAGIDLTYSVTNNLNFKIGMENWTLHQTALKQYQSYTGVKLGVGYFLPKKNEESNSDIELSMSASNSFAGFSSFKDYTADLGCRFYMFRSFYIGLGLRYTHNNTASFITTPIDDLNAYWQIGLQWNIATKRK